MTEWLKVRAWKVRIPQKGIGSSNLPFSATEKNEKLRSSRILSNPASVENLFS